MVSKLPSKAGLAKMDRGRTQLDDMLPTTYANSNYMFLVKHIKYKDTGG